MNKEQILELITNGESSTVEFKQEDVRPDSLASEIVSFSNFAGGTILIGVSDQGQITGVERADMEEFIINVCRNNVRPSLIPIIEKVRFDDKQIVAVTIQPGQDIYSTSKGHYYIRAGSTRQQPTQQELLRLFQKRNALQLDETPVLSATINSINLNRVDQYLRKLDQSPLNDTSALGLEQELTNLSILIETKSGVYPTVGGLLFFGKNPQKEFPSFIVSCGAYQGSDLDSEPIREDDIQGSIEELIENSIVFLKLTMPKIQLMERDVKRVETYLYPIDVLREAIVNAVCHRDYTITGSSIRIFLFSDRLEIRSPGGLPNTLTLQSMVYRQFTRNQTIASFLSGTGYMEKRGKGIIRIIKQCEKENIACDFSLSPDQYEFVLTLVPPVEK